MSTLASMRQKLLATEKPNTGPVFDTANYPFWNIKPNTTTTFRFLPDGDESNEFFWVEKLVIKLPFNGIKGGESKQVVVNVPCVEMFGKSEYPAGCPILSEVRTWYKSNDEAMKTTANKYWKKASYIMQGFVRENTVPDDKSPENPIRRVTLNKQLFNLVKAGLMDTDMQNLPTDYEAGTDFKIAKTMKGQYADYGTSSYARRETPLSSDERQALEQYGLSNLSQFLGKKPTADDLKVIKEMFEASVDGEEYDLERWGNYYRPLGLNKNNDGDEIATASAQQETTVNHQAQKQTTQTPATQTTNQTDTTKPTSDSKPNAADILAQIRSRKAK